VPTCINCPAGASCVNSSHVKALFGHARCPTTLQAASLPPKLVFQNCFFPGACAGAKNALYANQFVTVSGEDPSLLNQNESCAFGYKNSSLLCAACAKGYSHAGSLDKRCSKCPDEGSNIAIAVLGVLGSFGFVVVYVMLTIRKKKGKVRSSVSGSKSICLSFIQVISLLKSFPVPWPALFLSMFQLSTTVTVLGQHLVNLKCLVPTMTEADVFWSTRIVWALMPIVLTVGCLIAWHVYNTMTTVQDMPRKLKTTVVCTLYILWPGLCLATFEIFACESICDRSLLIVDLEEECWVGRHAMFAGFLGVPMLLLYVVSFPMFVMLTIKKMRNRGSVKNVDLITMKAHEVWGKFYR
jgi:hypothetical protein